MFRIRITKRQERRGWRSCLVVLTAIVLSLVLSGILLALRGTPPLVGLAVLFKGAFGSRFAIEDCLVKAIPIFLCSLGVAVAFRLQVWNIGAEGQFALGAVGATWVALSFPDLPGPILLPAMIAMAALAGGLWGMIPAILRQRLRTNEIIVTLMLNYIAILFLDYLVYGVWKDPTSFGFPMTREFSPQAVVGRIGSTSINWGLAHCLVLGTVVWVFIRFTRLGFELKAAGDSVRAARYAGIPYDRLVVLVMVISGALAGWAGFLEASATINRLQPSIMAGYGYTAIVVAWLARLNPLSIAFASFLLAGLRVGVENLQLDLQVPAAFGGILEGLILLTVLGGGLFTSYRIAVRRN
ncbi:MAG: ABC transporter permease [Desulfoprunum sp.]|jgi:simple sugar transport system permease protein|uniref:ABC transporter permease n=1 Tax=Desulfoprunum sp. TaxID=2020866 RepID=UPI00052D9ACE|nr:branched-chain amino acid ABC transporter permease [Desulfobulbus sp. Tol-SR]